MKSERVSDTTYRLNLLELSRPEVEPSRKFSGPLEILDGYGFRIGSGSG